MVGVSPASLLLHQGVDVPASCLFLPSPQEDPRLKMPPPPVQRKASLEPGPLPVSPSASGAPGT